MYKDWVEKLRSSKPLKHYCYWTGYLPQDRARSHELNKTARLLFALSELGYVTLYQKKLAIGVYAYFVVPCYRPLVERDDGSTYNGDLTFFRGSRGFEHGCIAEAEALAGLPLSERRKR